MRVTEASLERGEERLDAAVRGHLSGGREGDGSPLGEVALDLHHGELADGPVDQA